MNKRLLSYLTFLTLLLVSQISFGQRFWVAAGASNWNNTANWSTSSGGPGGASVPGPSDAVTFNANGLGNCTLDVAPNVAGITVNGYTGIIDINGFNLTTTGTNSFVSGTINNGGAAAAVTLNTTGTSTFSGTTFGANVNGSTGRIFFNGSTFTGTVTVNKTANNNDTSSGGNTFSGSVTLTNSSTSQFRLGGTNPDIFNGTLALVSGNTGPLEVAYSSAANQINNNVTVTYNATGLISIGAGGGTATLAASRTISVAGFGASGCGNLTLARLTQAGGTAQNISLGGNDTATLTLGPASGFSGALTISTPSIIFNSSSFQAVTVTKTGSQVDNSRGGNTFNGLMTVNNQGGDFAMGTNAADAGDTWNAAAIFNNTGGNRIRIGEDNAGNIFQSSATFNNTSATDIQSRIQISRFGTASVTFNGTTTFTNNAVGGDIHISYNAGSTTTFNGPVIINSNAGVTNVENWIGNNGEVNFNGSVTVTSSDRVAFGQGSGLSAMSAGNTISIGGGGFTGSELAIRNFTQAGSTAMNLALTGGTSLLRITSSTLGGNVTFSAPQFILTSSTFNGTASVTKTGATDNSSSGNTFNGVTTITHSGSSELFFGNGAADTFNAATTFNNTGSFRIRIAWNHNGSTTTFANNLTLNSNKSGGTDQWSFLVGENTNSNVSIGGDLIINCAGSLRSDHRFANGAGTTFTVGGNLVINNTNTDSGTIITMGVNGTSTYNGNITLTNTGGSNGVTFNSGASASATQAPTGSVSIAGGFTSGSLNIQRFTNPGTGALNLNLGGTTTLLRVGPATSFGGNADLRAPQLFLDGISIGGTAYLEKNGTTNNTGIGNNIFGSTATIVNNGSGFLRTNGSNTFNGPTTITNNSNGDVLLELVTGSTYNSSLTLVNSGSSNIRMAYTGASTFNGNIIVNSTAGTGITFCENTAGTATLAAGNTISIGGSGFSSGTLSLPRFTQVGATPQTLTAFSGTTTLIVGPASSFGGNVTFTAPQLLLNGCNFDGTATLEKSGATDNLSAGGNVFNGITTITNSGSGEIFLGNVNADAFNASTTFNNTGSYRIRFAYNHGGQTTTFAGDVTLNSNKSGGTDPWSFLVCDGTNTNVTIAGDLILNTLGPLRSDIRFLNGGNSTMLLSGDLQINTTNTNSATTITMGVNGTATYQGNILLTNTGGSNGVTFNSNAAASSTQAAGRTISLVTGFDSGSLNLYRFTQLGTEPTTLLMGGTTTITRLGPASTLGGTVNISSPRLFLDGVTIGGTATLEKTGASDDAGNGGNVFNGITTITNSGSGYLLTGNINRDQFNAATTFNSTGSYRIYFAHNHGGQTTTFASDLTLNSNKSGGTDAWAYLIGEGTNVGLSVAGTTTINCAGTIQSSHRILNGAASSAVFQGPVNINVTNTAAGTVIQMGENGTTTYNGNINVVTSGGSSGITFNGQTAASSTLNGVITAGTFSSGSLNLYRFTQVGALPENITLTGTSIMRVGPNSAFGGDVNFISPRIFLNGATYNGTASFEKTGTGDDASNGGNIFNGTTTLINSSSAIVYMANASPDIFNGQLTITNSGSNWIFMAHNVAGNQFNNNIIVNNSGSANGIIFSNNATGASTFTNGTISVGGSGFSVGDLRLRRFTQVGALDQNLTLTGSARLWIGPVSSFDGNVNFIAPQLLLSGAAYNGTAYVEKTGATNNDGEGGNIFNQQTTIVNSGSAYLLTGSTQPDIFNSNLIVTNSGSSTIRLADNTAGNQFNGNIQLNSTFGGGIYFGNNANGTSTLAATRTIGVGGSGVLSGDIRLIRFTQVGPTPQTLDLSGIAILTLGPASTFDGNIDFRAPQLLLNGTTYNGTAYLEKKGATDNAGTGGNTFNSTTSLVNSGSGYLLTANTLPDIFNGALTVTNTGSNIIYLAHNVAGSQFNGNITFNSTLGSAGIYFSNNATGSSTLGNGASLLVGGLGYSSGELRFRRFTQVGAAPQTLLLTGTALLRIGPSTTFNGNLDFRSPQIALEGAIYNGTTYLEKTGANNNDSNGGNTFNGTTTIANSGSGWFRFALTALDTFNGDLTLTNTGSSTIRMADNIPGTTFNGNITVNSTFGGGIYFSESGGGTATLAAGRTISVGGTGFSLGDLRIRRFTQIGATPQTLLLTGTSSLVLGPTISFDGAADFRAPQLFINGGIFNGTAFLEKTGATSNTGIGNTTFNGATTIQLSGSGFLRTNGGNTFNGVTNLINSGSNDLLLELTTASVYNNTVTMTNTGSSYIRPAYIGSNTFNGDIIVNSTSGTGIYFAENTAGSATLASGRTISVGGTGFTAGELRLQRFTQFGATAQNLALTGSSTLRTGPASTWNGNVTASAPALFLDGASFNGASTFTKTGASTDASIGGNVFVGAATFINSGTGVFRLGNTAVDEFIGATVFNQTSGTLQPAYNSASNFYNNVSVDGAAAVTFGANNGTIVLTGGSAQNINKLGTASPVFRRFTMNKSGNTATLNTDAIITTNGTFTGGVLLTTATNYLNFADNATVTGGSNASHVDGPVRKTGNDAFSFPTGDGGFYRPISISAPSNTAHFFTAEYFKASHVFGGPSTYPTGIVTVSSCEYWMLDRNPAVGGSNVSVTLSWNTPDCTGPYITNPANLRVVRWNGSAWVNHGNGGTTGNATNGTVISAGVITSFSPITLGSSGLDNPLPVELISFNALAENETVKLNWTTASELNNDYFTVQHSTDGVEFTSLGIVDGKGTTQNVSNYAFTDNTPQAGINYYRLKQTDFDGTSSYSNIIAINLDLEWLLYPNPATYGTDVIINKKGNYAVYNNLGVLVMKISDATKLDITSLAPGVYTVRNSNGSIRRLVVK